jgi:glutamate-1-semialdehyde 2,1-aminomutase
VEASVTWIVVALVVGALAVGPVRARLLLSKAKHRSVSGHARISRWLARLVPYYEYDATRIFGSDGASPTVVDRRRTAFFELAARLRQKTPLTLAMTDALEEGISDLQFTRRYRVPFQFSRFVRAHLPVGSVVQRVHGVEVEDLDGNLAFDAAGSYGLNVFGYEFYKECIDAGIARVRELGPLLGAYHPVVAENVERLRAISRCDEVSFHMSGTEAVMQAVRLARYHTRRSHVVQFCGAYHGWWDGVQPGVGNPRPVDDVYVLKDMDEDTMRVLRSRRDIACVLVNPLQALHPNAPAPADGTLVDSSSRASAVRAAYAGWLQRLRTVCSERGIPLIFDEVFLGFRLAYGGAQEYFDVQADMVTYGKTVGGGLPVGVLCGRHDLMKRFREDRPADVCFARGTFNAHPYVMGAMNEFLRRIDTPETRATYARADAVWNERAAALNADLACRNLPVQVANLSSVWTICYTTPSRYNWMFQYYLRAAGLALSWVGSGRLIFSLNCRDDDFALVHQRFLRGAAAMHEHGWWAETPGLTNAAIRRQVFREMVSARFSPAVQTAPSETIGSSISPRSTYNGAR